MRICSKNKVFFMREISTLVSLFLCRKIQVIRNGLKKIMRVPFPAASQVCPNSQTTPVLAAPMAARDAPDRD